MADQPIHAIPTDLDLTQDPFQQYLGCEDRNPGNIETAKVSRGNLLGQSNPDTIGAIQRIAKDGTTTVYTPTADTDLARGSALAMALGAVQNEDTLILARGKRYEGSGGILFSLDSRQDVTIRGGTIGRTAGTTFRVMLELSTCARCRLEDMIFDSRGGIQSPTSGSPSDHINTDPNENGFNQAYGVDLVGSVDCEFHRCTFRDIIGPEDMTTNGTRVIAEYAETHGINIQASAIGTKVYDSLFTLNGYSGLIDNAEGTHVRGNTFIDNQHTAFTVRGGGGLYEGNNIKANGPTGLGYAPLTVNVNPGAQIKNALIFKNNDFTAEYDDTAADGGMFCYKFEDCDIVTVDGGRLKHGLNGSTTAPGLRDSIRAQGNAVGNMTLKNIDMSGAIGLIDPPRRVDKLVIDNCDVNTSGGTSTAIWVTANEITVTNSRLHFSLSGLWPTEGGDRIGRSLTLHNNKWLKNGTTSTCRCVPADFIADIADKTMMDETNVLSNDAGVTFSRDGMGSGSTLITLSETAVGRTQLRTNQTHGESDFDDTLTGDFALTSVNQKGNKRRLEINSAVPTVAGVNGVIDADSGSNYQTVEVAAEITALSFNRALVDADIGTTYDVVVKPNGNNVSPGAQIDPFGLYTQPSTTEVFTIGVKVIRNSAGSIVGRFMGAG